MDVFYLAVRWFIGLYVVSLLLGHLLSSWVLRWLRRKEKIGMIMRLTKQGREEWENLQLTGRWFGLLERSIFTIMVVLTGINGALAVMIAWIGAKMILNWKHTFEWSLERKPCDYEEDAWSLKVHMFARTSLLGNLISIFFASLGGLICAGKLF